MEVQIRRDLTTGSYPPFDLSWVVGTRCADDRQLNRPEDDEDSAPGVGRGTT